jgi:hypothetical protein
MMGVGDLNSPPLMDTMLSDGGRWSELINGIEFNHLLRKKHKHNKHNNKQQTNTTHITRPTTTTRHTTNTKHHPHTTYKQRRQTQHT